MESRRPIAPVARDLGPKTLVWTQGEHTDVDDREPLASFVSRTAAAHLKATLEVSA